MDYVIGLDLGGTNLDGGLIDLNGKIIKNISVPSGAEEGGDKVFAKVLQIISDLYHEKVVGIGLATAGFVDHNKGQVLWSGNINNWSGFEIKKRLREFYPDLIVEVHNDANMAGVCEAWLGHGKNLKNFVILTLGTGLGGGIYSSDFGLLYGSNYKAGELGHTILYPEGRQCNCGQKGCVEMYLSGSALSYNYEELTGEELTGHEIINLYGSDEAVKKSLDKYTSDMSYFLASIINFVDPEAIILAGGFINSKEYWWDDLIKKYKANVNRPEQARVLVAKYKNHSGILGSAKMVIDKWRETNA